MPDKRRRIQLGDRFGRVRVICQAPTVKRQTYYRVHCGVCGEQGTMLASRLKPGDEKLTCGCVRKGGSLHGHKQMRLYGRLLAFPDVPSVKLRMCICKGPIGKYCGRLIWVSKRDLIRGRQKSCGCLRRKVHGNLDKRTFDSWRAMLQRCHDPKHASFKNYGGRKIKVCERWRNNPMAFEQDMGLRPDGRTLDRKNVDGDYEPDNCKWSTPAEQAANRRKNAGAASPPY